MAVVWLGDVRTGDLDLVGGKGASLGELIGAGLPVSPGFVVTASTYRALIEDAGIDDELFAAVEVDHEDSEALRAAHETAHDLIIETSMPDDVREEILSAYRSVGEGDASVAVRSSATAEDLPDASFAGQQETFLNVTEEDLLDRVKECWASLFFERAIYYHSRKGFLHDKVDIAVVVQQMVDAEKSGVTFTRHPSTGKREIITEAAWSLGEVVVSGTVSPNNYVVSRETGKVETTAIADKKTMCVHDEESGETVMHDVPNDRRHERVLTDDKVSRLLELGELVEDHYEKSQDVEWAVCDGEVYMLQSHPITTTAEGDDGEETESEGDSSGSSRATATDDDVLTRDLGASPGIASGCARVATKLDHLDQVTEGDIIVTEMTMPDMVPAMERAAGTVTDESGMTSHAAIVSRELGVPAVVGTGDGTKTLEDGKVVTIDDDKGTIREGEEPEEKQRQPVGEARPKTPVKPMTATEVKVNVSIPEVAERAAATDADGIGLLRIEHMVLTLGKTPGWFIEQNGKCAYVGEIVLGVREAAEEFYPRPVRIRTLDVPTDELRQLEGGENEPREYNPMFGYRGVCRGLGNPSVFRLELQALRHLFNTGYDNLEVMFPLVSDAEDVLRAKEHVREVGIDPEEREWGVMAETPAAALCIGELADAGIDFTSFGMNDLTQYTLTMDRNNEHVTDIYDELYPAVPRLIGDTIETCREVGVKTNVCGQAGSKPKMVQFLVDKGVSSISANIDAVRDVQHEIKRVEQRLLFGSVR